MVRLGAILTASPDSDRYNPTLAIQYLTKAAEAGNADAQNLLGQTLELGLDGIAQPEKALDLYRVGASQGHSGSMYNLGACYENGVGVVKDFNKAVKMYEEVSDNDF
jgi:TPR repeat protein